MLLATHSLSIAIVNDQAQQLHIVGGMISWSTSKEGHIDKVYFDRKSEE